MTETPVLSRKTGITLMGGGEIDTQDVYQALEFAPHLVAADGGANKAMALDLMPEAVIGDLDSLSAQARNRIAPDRIHHVAEQDSVDFEKALRLTCAPFYLGLGFTGRRVDHTLAALSVLVRFPERPILLLDASDIIFSAPPEMRLDLPVGMRLSLYPLGPCDGSSTGLQYPLDGVRLDPVGMIGTSNKVTGPVTLKMTGPCLVILPKAALRIVLHGLGLR
ncbi:thiamine diphosphokinase [Thioclava sp. GXIMD2076]|uniref:thiamine diphosphokinase n=1 Tax=Thioclava sp. GXIMD2076 TaxID=3131931 RepID=UPI0030D02403